MKIDTTWSAANVTPVECSIARASKVETSVSKLLGFNVRRVVTAIVVAILMASCSGCQSSGVGENSMLPRELQGAWVTDDPQFAERLVDFWPGEFVILTGVESQAAFQSVDKVDRKPYGSGFTLTIYSTNRAGARDQMGITYSPANGGELRFRNQRQVWHRIPQS